MNISSYLGAKYSIVRRSLKIKYVKLGKSYLKVSRICMGCMGFGNAAAGQHSCTLDENQMREIIKHGLELGINFYDTAIANGKQKAGNVV